METPRIREYIEDWYRKELPVLLPREAEVTRIQGKVIFIVGPKESRKDILFLPVNEVRERNFVVYLDFEDPSLLTVKFDEVMEIAHLFTEITGKEPRYIFLDEIQNLDKWETAVRTLLDRRKTSRYAGGLFCK
jgi:predicted AAA+ superfamily ATPase